MCPKIVKYFTLIDYKRSFIVLVSGNLKMYNSLTIFGAMFTLRKLAALVVLLLLSLPALAQWEWIEGSTGSNFERNTGVAINETTEAIYSVGVVTSATSIPGLQHYHGGEDGYVRKLDFDGNTAWAFAIGGSDDDRIQSIDVDETTGLIYVTGFIEGDFGSSGTSLIGTTGGLALSILTSPGNRNSFVACYNPAGQLQWQSVFGSNGIDEGYDIAVNASGVYAVGVFKNTGFLTTLSSVLPTDGDFHNYVLAFNKATGVQMWGTVLGSNTDDFTQPASNNVIKRIGISADQNNIYLVTHFNGTLYSVYDGANNLAATLVDILPSDEDIVVTSYSNAGAHNWSKLYDNVGTTVWGLDITSDCNGVYVSGTLHDGSITPSGVVISSDHDNFFLSKLNKSTGNELWLRQFQSEFNHDDHFVGIQADGYGNLYAVGRMRGTEIDVEIPSVFSYDSGQNFGEVMIAHYQTDGVFRSFEVIPSSANAWGMSVATYKKEKY